LKIVKGIGQNIQMLIYDHVVPYECTGIFEYEKEPLRYLHLSFQMVGEQLEVSVSKTPESEECERRDKERRQKEVLDKVLDQACSIKH
jgi:hypothetical protein